MKKRALLLIVIMLVPLIAQQEQDEDMNLRVRTGLLLEKKDNQINFEEAWIDIVSPRVKNARPVIIVDAQDQPIMFEDLTAPCQVEMTLTYDENRQAYVPLKIIVLQQYRYDEKGFIKTDQ
jgi:hypothetical protein